MLAIAASINIAWKFFKLFMSLSKKRLHFVGNGGILTLENVPYGTKVGDIMDATDAQTYLPVLLQCFLFRGLSAAELSQLLTATEPPQQVEKGRTVYQPENFRHALAVVLTGELQVTCGTGNRRHAILNTLIAGNVCGAAALFGEGDTYVTEITAMQDTALLFIRQTQLSAWFARYPQLAENYICFLTDRIRFLNKKISTYTGGQTDDRLWQYLCDHATADGGALSAGSLTDLARSLDIGRSSLYRSLDALETAGRIRREGKKIFVTQSPIE